MTEIQVKYWANQETQRHNEATEKQAAQELTETGRHNLATESTASRQVSENVRHNKVSEGQNLMSIKETSRHNLVTESQGQQNINETVRHNKKSEQLTSKTIKETTRHNKATEKEATRHNSSTESLTAQSNKIAQQNANTQASKVAAENALTNAKTWAQKWLNQWKTKNPTTASLKEAGVMTNNSKLGQILQVIAVSSDALGTIVSKISNGKTITAKESQKVVKKAISTGTATKAGSDGTNTYYRLNGLKDSSGKDLYFSVNNKTGSINTTSSMKAELVGAGKGWLQHALGADNNIKY